MLGRAAVPDLTVFTLQGLWGGAGHKRKQGWERGWAWREGELGQLKLQQRPGNG